MTILETVKTSLQITGTAFDGVLNIHIEEAKEYLRSAGVNEAVIEGEMSKGVLCHMVTDLWTLNGGESKLSPYTMQRIVQLQNEIGEAAVDG